MPEREEEVPLFLGLMPETASSALTARHRCRAAAKIRAAILDCTSGVPGWRLAAMASTRYGTLHLQQGLEAEAGRGLECLATRGF